MRTFTASPAKRQAVRLLLGLYGPSGGGKTLSALRLANGIRRVQPGPIYVIDTEEGRSLHYADAIEFTHVPFRQPFGPADYLAAFEFCVKEGARTVVVDSMSHEHEGPGGVLEQHDAVVADRGQSHSMSAWIKPKTERRRLINTLVQMPVNVILCFRAKEKIKPQPKSDANPRGEPTLLGWMPIGGDEFAYEMVARCLLPPGADGVPVWKGEHEGDRGMIKRPAHLASVLRDGRQLSEEVGEELALWANGGTEMAQLSAAGRITPASWADQADGCETLDHLTALWKRVPKAARTDDVTAAFQRRRQILTEPPREPGAEG